MTAIPADVESSAVRWLRGDVVDRARFADTSRRFRRPELFGVMIGGTKLLAAYWYGWPLVVQTFAGFATLAVAGRLLGRTQHPQIGAAVTFILLELNLAAAVFLTGGASSPLLPLLAVPVFSQAVCFRPRVFVAAVVASAALALPAVLLAPRLAPGDRAPGPVFLISYLALLVCLAAAALFLADADLSARDDAVVDPMTGLLNRLTLEARFSEARAQAARTGSTVGLVMCDVDHFKQVNDGYGHARGDQVLRELADVLRRTLRTGDLAFRIGGEEFVVLLPGHDTGSANQVAERIRTSVAAAELGGLPVTLSAGVVASTAGRDGLADLLQAADAALYAPRRPAGTGRSPPQHDGGVMPLPSSPATYVERALCVLAHPDDVDFGSAGTVATWTAAGTAVSYLIVTDGDAGGFDETPREQMGPLRRAEQTAAAKAVGVTDVRFLGYPDGRLELGLDLRRDISRVIRQVRPQRVLTSSPERFYERIGASHPDHMTVGESTLRAVYPDARNPFAFPELLADEGLDAWTVPEVWLGASPRADHAVDVTDVVERKFAALASHVTQVGHLPEGQLREFVGGWMRQTARQHDLPDGRFAEAFHVVHTG